MCVCGIIPTRSVLVTPYQVVNFNQYKSKYDQLQVIESWHLRGGVGIISYDTYRILTSVKAKRTARQCERLRTCLRDPGELHVESDSGTSICVVYSGTPVLWTPFGRRVPFIIGVSTFQRYCIYPLQSCSKHVQ